MKTPTSAKIGYLTFSITEWTNAESDAQGLNGRCDSNNGHIHVRGGLCPQKKAATLLHEILHAIYYTQSISNDDDEERTVTAMANGLAQMWRDNPELTRWIGAQLK